MNVIPNKEYMLIIHKFELNCIFRIKSDSSSAEFARYKLCCKLCLQDANAAEDEFDLIRNIQFNHYALHIRNYIHFIFAEIISRKRILAAYNCTSVTTT